MAKTEKIFHGKKLVGVKIKVTEAGSIPVTDSSQALQILTLRHRAGKVVAPHYHKPVARTTRGLQECIVVVRGKIRVDIYGSGKTPFKCIVLKPGEAYLNVNGGIGITYLEKSDLLEFKNGPFKDDQRPVARS